MPKIGHSVMYFWSEKEKAFYNTERHQIFKEELYPLAQLSRTEFQERLKEFKEKNFDLLNKKVEG